MLTAQNTAVYFPLADAGPTRANLRGCSGPNNAYNLFEMCSVVTNWLDSSYKKGYRRFLLWNPGGLDWQLPLFTMPTKWTFTLNGVAGGYQTPQCFDQFAQIKDSGLYKEIVNTFAMAINAFKATHPGSEVIVYLGTAMGCPRIEPLKNGDLLAYVMKCVAPLLESGCNLAVDSSCMVPDGHWLAQIVPVLESYGMKFMAEACPWRYPWLQNRGFVCDLLQLRNLNPSWTQELPPLLHQGCPGFWDPAKEMSGVPAGYRMGALFGEPLSVYRSVIPRAFNSGQIDAILVNKDCPASLSQLDSSLEVTDQTNYGDYLTPPAAMKARHEVRLSHIDFPKFPHGMAA